MTIQITESEVQEALAAAITGNAPHEARTLREIVADTGLGQRAVINALRWFQSRGRLQVYSVHRPALDGAMRTAPAYVIRPESKTSQKPKPTKR